MTDFIIDHLMMPFMAVVIVGVLLLGGYAIYDEATSDKFYLRKDSWLCTANHTETSMIYVGKVLVPDVHSVCDQWSRA